MPKTAQIQPPSVKITYDVDSGGAIEKQEIPFLLGVFADLSVDRSNLTRVPFEQRAMLEINQDNFADVLKSMQPRIDLGTLDTAMLAAGLPTLSGSLQFSCLADFEPGAVAQQIAALQVASDERLKEQLALVMQAPSFRNLAATWQGLFELLAEATPSTPVRVMNATRQELLDDVQQATTIEQSTLFEIINTAAYGTLGGTPYSLLLGAYAFGDDEESLAGLDKLAEVAAFAHAPFIGAAGSSLCAANARHKQADAPARPQKNAEPIDWLTLQNQQESSRYICLALPPEGALGEGSAAFALARRITAAFARNHWPVAFAGRSRACGPSAMARAEDEPLGVTAMLPYLLAASRFAHYIKTIIRDKVGSFLTRGNVESYLNSWISQYVLLDEHASQAAEAAFPLRAASVVVTDIPGEPGAYRATAFLRPHFQLAELSTSIRLVIELPQ